MNSGRGEFCREPPSDSAACAYPNPLCTEPSQLGFTTTALPVTGLTFPPGHFTTFVRAPHAPQAEDLAIKLR